MIQTALPVRREERFVAYLAGLAAAEDRAALAALRRSLGKAPGEAAEAYRYVAPWLPDTPRWGEEEAYCLVAALFAWHPHDWPANERVGPTNLGASLRRLAERMERRNSGAGGSAPAAAAMGSTNPAVERRLVALLNCHRDDLPEHLRRVVGLLRAHDVPVDWALLLRDVRDWQRDDRRVQRAWARAYWTDTGTVAAPADQSAAPPRRADDADAEDLD